MPVLSVAEFNEVIQRVLDQTGEFVVEGEIAELKVSQGKWVFGTIKDETAAVDIFGTVYEIRNLNSLAAGMQVRVSGRPRLYQKTGRFSLGVTQIVPSGAGALQLAFEKLKLLLEKEGLFALDRKRPLPAFPQHIGLITAKGSQAYADFVKVLGERMGGIKIYFYPTSVQGHDAVPSILQAFRDLNLHHPELDLIVLTRGGGSLEDLSAFNDEQVVRTIFSSPIPVVCGIGHEENISLAELAADRRASTPSNAAELIVRERRDVLEQVLQLEQLVNSRLTHRLSTVRQQVENHQLKLERFMTGYLRQIEHQVAKFWSVVQTWNQQLTQRVTALEKQLADLDYRQILHRGFSLTYNQDAQLIRSITQVADGQPLTTVLSDGTITSQVTRRK